MDLDHDGDLDILLKNRNGPQVRVLRNDTATTNHSVAIRLVGRRSNRDAVGSVVTLKTAAGQRTKLVKLGDGFLSQSTLWLYFGLGDTQVIEEAVIQWPNGGEQVFQNLPVGHRITIIEGEETFKAVPFEPRKSEIKACLQQEKPPVIPSQGIALVKPVPLPPYTLESLQGKPVVPAKVEGSATLLNLWATWCAPCQIEMDLWKKHYSQIRAAGAELIAVSVDEPGDRQKVEEFVRKRALPFPVLLMSTDILQRFSIFYRFLFVRSGDPQIPTTFLLNKRGEIAKIYLGIVPMDVLLKDLKDLARRPQELARSALPYSGKNLAMSFARDYSAMATQFNDRNMLAESSFFLEQAVQEMPSDASSWNKLGLLYAKMNQLQQSRTALQRAVRLDPNSANGQFDLGITLLRLNQSADAEKVFSQAARLDPSDPRKNLMHEMTRAQNGNGGDLVQVLKDYLQVQPGDAEAQNNLGALYTGQGLHWLALEQFEKATQLDPFFPRAHRNLGVTYMQNQMPTKAIASLERYLTLEPNDPEAYLVLAFAYGSLGRREDAIQSLERVLQLQPEHPRARELLQRLRSTP